LPPKLLKMMSIKTPDKGSQQARLAKFQGFLNQFK
jgi:hypothetical protein